MKKLLACVIFVALSLFAQGIKSPIANLALEGTWEEHANWIGKAAAERESAFYDPQSGTLIRLGEDQAWSDERANQIAGSLQKTIPANTLLNPSNLPHLQFQRNLASTYFPLPDGFIGQNQARIEAGEKLLPVWEMQGIRGNVTAFYASQLSPGLKANRSGRNVTIYTEWNPARLIRAERRQIGAAGAILAELETESPVSKEIVERFGMPPSLAEKKIRYTFVVYAAFGFVSSAKQIKVVSAGPADSEIHSEAILSLLAQRPE